MTGAAGEHVVSGAADQDVVAIAAEEGVGASQALEAVGALAAGDVRSRRGTDDVLDAVDVDAAHARLLLARGAEIEGQIAADRGEVGDVEPLVAAEVERRVAAGRLSGDAQNVGPFAAIHPLIAEAAYDLVVA